MRKSLIKLEFAGWMMLVVFLASSTHLQAGNKDRIGQAGASELLINPWTRSNGFGSANTAASQGLESMHLNVAGLAFTNKTELLFSRTAYLVGSETNINAFGLSQRLSETSVLGIGVMSMDFGDLNVTTENLPEGGSGTFSPQYLNVGVSYAREFSNSIYGGATLKTISESIADANALGVAFDAGIRYVTGEKDNLKFGIALRNVGPKMQFRGDGFATKVSLNDEEITLSQRTEGFELPALLNIGIAYDYYLFAKADSSGSGMVSDHRITGAFSFTSNSFGKDQLHFGAEYGFRNLIMIRGGYVWEDGLLVNTDERNTAFSGPAAGVTLQIPLNDKGGTIDIDYSYRVTNPFDGTNSIGLRLNI
ncbi:MAG: PorV/PorQ family protein [Salibacteraceae bacterium]